MRNARSRAAIERLGFRLDGVLRAASPAADGGIRDTATYSLLASEWPEARQRLTARLRRRALSGLARAPKHSLDNERVEGADEEEVRPSEIVSEAYRRRQRGLSVGDAQTKPEVEVAVVLAQQELLLAALEEGEEAHTLARDEVGQWPASARGRLQAEGTHQRVPKAHEAQRAPGEDTPARLPPG